MHKGYVVTPLRLEDKPRPYLGHDKDILRTTKRQKQQMRTNLTKGHTNRKYNFTKIIMVQIHVGKMRKSSLNLAFCKYQATNSI